MQSLCERTARIVVALRTVRAQLKRSLHWGSAQSRFNVIVGMVSRRLPLNSPQSGGGPFVDVGPYFRRHSSMLDTDRPRVAARSAIVRSVRVTAKSMSSRAHGRHRFVALESSLCPTSTPHSRSHLLAVDVFTPTAAAMSAMLCPASRRRVISSRRRALSSATVCRLRGERD